MSAVVDFPVKPEARPYLDAFGRAASGEPQVARRAAPARRSPASPSWVFRRGASEAWRFTDLRPLAAKPMLPPAIRPRAVPGAAIRISSPDSALPSRHRIVLVDGRFAPELSAVGATA